MAITYEETATLMHDATFQGRVGVACVNYARYISDEAPGTAGHSSRYRWSQQTMVNPMQSVNQCIATVVTDTAVQADGAAITDQNLQSAVENAVNKII